MPKLGINKLNKSLEIIVIPQLLPFSQNYQKLLITAALRPRKIFMSHAFKCRQFKTVKTECIRQF